MTVQETAGYVFGRVTQDPMELATFLAMVDSQRPKVVLEIGCEYGGSLTAWARHAAPDALLIGVDLDTDKPRVEARDSQQVALVQGNSTDPETLDRVRAILGDREVDFLFIDGEHSYRAALSDFTTYSRLVRRGGLVAFHDVAGNNEVKAVWREVEERFPGAGLIWNANETKHRMGIGYLRIPETGPRYLKQSTIGLTILAYARPDLLGQCLTSLYRYGTCGLPVRVVEDLPPSKKLADWTEEVCRKHGVPLIRHHKWGCIQGNANFALLNSPEDWVIIYSDDVLFTPGALANTVRLIHDHEESPGGEVVGLLQPPYWNAQQMVEFGLLPSVECLTQEPERLERIPENPHWKMEQPKLYVSVHGSGFVVRRRAWESVGGFSPDTWCWDEDLSCKVWFYTPYSVFACPGPPVVHGIGSGAGGRPQPQHDYGTTVAWERSWGRTKGECDHLARQAMDAAGGDGCPIWRARRREKGCLQ